MGDTFTTREARLQDPKNRQNPNRTSMTKATYITSGDRSNVKLLIKQGLYEWAIPTES